MWGEHLHKIIACFCDIMGISNICKAIDGTHISLFDLPNKRMTFVASDLFNGIFFHNIVLQVVGMCVLVTLAESTMVSSSRCQAFISNWRIVKYYKSPAWLLEVFDAHLFSLLMLHIRFNHICKRLQKPLILMMWIKYDMFQVWILRGLAFGSLKNRWHTLKHLNSKVDQVFRVVVSYVLHNYCMDEDALKPRLPKVTSLDII